MKILGSDHSKWKLLKKAIEQYVAPELSEILYRVVLIYFESPKKTLLRNCDGLFGFFF